VLATITRESLRTLIHSGADVVLVDVLSPDSYRAGHLPGAINIPVNDLEEEAPGRVARADVVVVYCASFECHASRAAAQELEALGYLHVIEYEGGLADWTEAGYPLESGEPAAAGGRTEGRG
jgi:rhodanese-related sulfurtransferase